MTRPRPRRALLAASAAAALAAVTALAACGSSSDSSGSSSSAPPSDGSLTVGLLGDIGQPPDPDIYYASNGLAIVLNVYDGLVQYKNNVDTVEIAPRLATSWTVSPDNKVYTFTLRQGVKFHDGTPFTSEAVKASFARRNAVKGGASYMTADVKSVDTSDPNKAVVTLNKSNSAFLDYLASPFGPKMESPAGIKKYAGSDNGQKYLQSHDIGSGPYELAQAVPGTKYVLKQFKDYWRPNSPFTTINLPIYKEPAALELALDAGDVHAVVAALPSTSLKKYENNDKFGSYLLPTLQGAMVTVNASREFFKTTEARIAFLESFDREKLIPQVLGDRSALATTMYAQGMLPAGKDVQAINYNPQAMVDYAKTLPAGTKLLLGFGEGNTNAEQIANIMVANLQALGIKASAQGYPLAQVFGWVNDPPTGPDAFVDGNNGPDGGNPYMWGHVFWDASGGINYFRCEDKTVNNLLNEAVVTNDTDKYVQAGELYGKTGCYLNFSYNKNWVVTQPWLTNVPEAQNISANELDFSILGVKK